MLVASLLALAGARVAVHVMPPSLLVNADRVPLGTVTSAPLNPVTASLKVKVTVALEPIASVVSEIVMADARVGPAVSTA